MRPTRSGLRISGTLIVMFLITLTYPAFSQLNYILRFQHYPLLFAQKVASSHDGKQIASFGTGDRNRDLIPYFVNVDDSGKFVSGKYFQFPEERFGITAVTGTSEDEYALAGIIRKNDHSA